VRIIGAIIDGPINLTNAQILCEVQLLRCRFMSIANFRRASFAGLVMLDGSAFKADVNFNGIKVGFGILLRKAVFEGSVNFISADVAIALEALGAKFLNKKQRVTCNSMKVEGYALFNDAVFEGPVNFGGANIAGNLKASGAKFQNKEKEAYFNGIKVGHDAFFDKAVFEGPVNFVGADIADSFQALGAKFLNKEQGVTFNSMKVGHNALFAQRDLFNDAVFEGPVNFDYAAFDLVRLPKVIAHFHMRGISYKYISAGPEERESHKELLKLADQSAYTADVYSNLEGFFFRQGYRADADKAFIAGKRREREEYFRNHDWFGWLGSWTLDLLVGYGRRPWQAGIPCAVLVALGCVLFSPKKMEPQKPEDTPRIYSRFWYSLGLFLPVVDLQADTVWKPKAGQTFLRNYARVHALLGWILIPIVLAALAGLIK